MNSENEKKQQNAQMSPHPRRFRVSPDAVANRVGAQVVLVNVRTDRIFSLNPTAARLWELLSTGANSQEIKERLQKEFAVSDEQLNSEMETLLASFREEGLIELDEDK